MPEGVFDPRLIRSGCRETVVVHGERRITVHNHILVFKGHLRVRCQGKPSILGNDSCGKTGKRLHRITPERVGRRLRRFEKRGAEIVRVELLDEILRDSLGTFHRTYFDDCRTPFLLRIVDLRLSGGWH